MHLSDCHPLIISGAPRSGTSLLYNLFDGHPDVSWLVDEGFLFEYLNDIGAAGVGIFLDAVPTDIDDIVRGVRDKQVMPPLHLPFKQSKELGTVSTVDIDGPWSEAAFRAALKEPRGADVADLWRWLVVAFLAGMYETPKRYACMKSPDYGKSSAAALGAIPETRTIVIVRDPLFAVDSLKRSREMRGEKLLTWPLIAQTIRNFQKLHERVRGADPKRLRAVRFESLTANPKGTMSDLADWLGIPFDPCLLQPTMRGQYWPGVSSFSVTSGIETAPTERPIQALTGAEQDLIRAHLGGLRKAFDYG